MKLMTSSFVICGMDWLVVATRRPLRRTRVTSGCCGPFGSSCVSTAFRRLIDELDFSANQSVGGGGPPVISQQTGAGFRSSSGDDRVIDAASSVSGLG